MTQIVNLIFTLMFANLLFLPFFMPIEHTHSYLHSYMYSVWYGSTKYILGWFISIAHSATQQNVLHTQTNFFWVFNFISFDVSVCVMCCVSYRLWNAKLMKRNECDRISFYFLFVLCACPPSLYQLDLVCFHLMRALCRSPYMYIYFIYM